MMDFAHLYSFWYVLFHVHSVFVDESSSKAHILLQLEVKKFPGSSKLLIMLEVLFNYWGHHLSQHVQHLESRCTPHLETILPNNGTLVHLK